MKLRWNSPEAVRRSLAKINNMLLNREIDPIRASKAARNANLILKALELEQTQKNRENEEKKQ